VRGNLLVTSCQNVETGREKCFCLVLYVIVVDLVVCNVVVILCVLLHFIWVDLVLCLFNLYCGGFILFCNVCVCVCVYVCMCGFL
jgi:hypothetical protein